MIPIIDPKNLEIGAIYRLSKDTPLMPSPKPFAPLKALAKAKKIHAGGAIKIIKAKKFNNILWYKAGFQNTETKKIEKVWINATALVGQKLEEIT